jgi:hypothetical protein
VATFSTRLVDFDGKTAASTHHAKDSEMSNVTDDVRLDPASDKMRAVDAAPERRYVRRLSDKVLIAFHHACDQSDFDVALQLLQVLELMLTRRSLTADPGRRRNVEGLVAAHERLWHLKRMHSEPP